MRPSFVCCVLVTLGMSCGERHDASPARIAAGASGAAHAPLAEQRDPIQAERGRYLVSHVAACADCHSPRSPDGGFDPARWLSGVDCFIDAVPDDPNVGCLNTRNLTDHETGLRNRTDQEIKDMFLQGVRPDGKALHPMMPYAYFGNMRADDADAIVAYLRTVAGVDHMVERSQPPFVPPPAPQPRIPEGRIPLPRADYPDPQAAMRGRYLAGNIGACLDCHTRRTDGEPVTLETAFAGGGRFTRAQLELPPSFPDMIYTPNLTPHATGIAGYSVDAIVRALKHGEDPNQPGSKLCPPMPAGPRGPFGGITDADASDIAHYLLSLPPREHAVPEDCAERPVTTPADDREAQPR